MLARTLVGGALILSASVGHTQQTMHAERIPGLVKDAGVYHLATGTWTRGGQQESLGPKVLYQNSASTGFFGIMGVPADLVWTDEGRVPSTSGHPNATADRYLVNGLTLAYCSSVIGAPQNGGVAFYDLYTSCSDPIGLSAVGAFTFAVPGGSASGALCWIVTFDLSGTSLEWNLSGDGDGAFDGTSTLDNFGWTLSLADQGTGGFNGPFLCGDPNNYAYGDGTYYQNSGASYGTGLGTVDQFWLTDASATYANGCYWCHSGGCPYASFWLTLFGEDDTSSNYTKYCTAISNSAGAPADIAGSGGTSAGSGTVTMTSSPVPDQLGAFFHAANQAQLPFGCSFLCAMGTIQRGTVTNGSANLATYTYDNSDSKHMLGAFVGQARNFQYWYRDPSNSANCGGQTFNTSNALQMTVTN